MKCIADNWKFILGICLFIGSLFLAVFLFSLPAKWPLWNIQSKGGTGDAINGMTAPIIGTVGAILIFVSFREQVKANKLQFESTNRQRELEINYRFYVELKEDLRSIQSVYGTQYINQAILEAFFNEIKADSKNHSSFNDLHIFLKYLNDQFIFISPRLAENKSLGEDEAMSLMEKVIRLYALFFGRHYEQIIQSPFQSKLSKEFKADIQVVVEIVELLNRRYNELITKKMDGMLEGKKIARRLKNETQ